MQTFLSFDEQEELVVLKNAINDNISTVHYNKLERFTELFVKTIQGKGENGVFLEPTNF